MKSSNQQNFSNPTSVGNPFNLHSASLFRIFALICLSVIISVSGFTQLGTYSFTGVGVCPHQNPNVSVQPANSVFTAYTSANMTCVATTDVYKSTSLNTGGSI